MVKMTRENPVLRESQDKQKRYRLQKEDKQILFRLNFFFTASSLSFYIPT